MLEPGLEAKGFTEDLYSNWVVETNRIISSDIDIDIFHFHYLYKVSKKKLVRFSSKN